MSLVSCWAGHKPCSMRPLSVCRKGLSHPVQNFGRGFLIALSFMGCLHIANIATHVRPEL